MAEITGSHIRLIGSPEEVEKSKGMKAPKENQKVVRERWTEKEAS